MRMAGGGRRAGEGETVVRELELVENFREGGWGDGRWMTWLNVIIAWMMNVVADLFRKIKKKWVIKFEERLGMRKKGLILE